MSTQLIRGIHNLQDYHQGSYITVGNFDGVHVGHRMLLDQLKQKASVSRGKTLVLTFEPQPLEFFSPERQVPRLTRFREKFYQLVQLGIDYVLVVRFDDKFANLTAEQFIEKILYDTLKIKHIHVGDDFHFGSARQGDLRLLKDRSRQFGFDVSIMTDIKIDDERVSSTRVRRALQVADHALVNRLLGRPYTMMGRIVYGNQLGRRLGFPTANIYLHRNATPVLGIYIVRLYGINQKGLPGVANVGIRPTVGGTRTLLEVYLFNFNQNIYGKYVTVEFCEKLRDEVRFNNLDLLKEQMVIDAAQARDYFIARDELPNGGVD